MVFKYYDCKVISNVNTSMQIVVSLQFLYIGHSFFLGSLNHIVVTKSILNKEKNHTQITLPFYQFDISNWNTKIYTSKSDHRDPQTIKAFIYEFINNYRQWRI